MGKKINAGGYNEKASRIFTDREEPRAAFRKKYEQVKKEISAGDNEIHILSYYGIGGIGKSRLLEKLKEELGEMEETPLYAFFDFDVGDDSKMVPDRYTVLTSLRNQLCEKYTFHFSLLDTAMYVHAAKVGKKRDSLEVKQLTEKSMVLKGFDIVGEFVKPVGLAVNMVNALDKSQASIRTYLKQNSRIIDEMERMDAREIYRRLPFYFSKDLADNLTKQTKPLVVFLDSYERLVNEITGPGDAYSNDLWLRDDNGPIQRTPGALWVVAGREKLKWDVFDPELKDNIEQHLLGDLSLSDSNSFLAASGVGGEELREQIYKLTGGTPLYLDLCVSRYNDILRNGETPVISMFGNTPSELIERFVRYMSADVREFVYKLVCIGSWDDKTLMEILPDMNLLIYDEVKSLSFVLETEGGGYIIHRTVGEILFKNCSPLIREKTADEMLKRFLPIVKQKEFSQSYATALAYAVRAAVVKFDDMVELVQFFARNILEYLKEYAAEGYFEQAGYAFDAYYERMAKYNRSEQVVALVTKIDLLEYGGEYNEALEMAEAAYEFILKYYPNNPSIKRHFIRKVAILKRHCGDPEGALPLMEQVLDICRSSEKDNEIEIANVLNDVALCYSALTKFPEALEKLDEAQEICRRKLKEDDGLSLTVMANRASIMKYISKEKCIEAVEIQRKCVELHKKAFGEKHANTLNAMAILGSTLRELGELEEAAETQKTVMELSEEKFGENHPDAVLAKKGYASILARMKDEEKINEAIDLLYDVVEKNKKFMGENHPDTAANLSLLGHTLLGAKRCEEALEKTKEAREKYEYLYGETSDNTLSATYGVALCYDYCKKPFEACEWYKRNYELRRSVNHPGTPLAMKRYMEILLKTGDKQGVLAVMKDFEDWEKKNPPQTDLSASDK